MTKKVEWFKYEKLGAKRVPLRYLVFSHAFGGKPCSYTRVVTTSAPHRLVPVLVRARAACTGSSPFWTEPGYNPPASCWCRCGPGPPTSILKVAGCGREQVCANPKRLPLLNMQNGSLNRCVQRFSEPLNDCDGSI